MAHQCLDVECCIGFSPPFPSSGSQISLRFRSESLRAVDDVGRHSKPLGRSASLDRKLRPRQISLLVNFLNSTYYEELELQQPQAIMIMEVPETERVEALPGELKYVQYDHSLEAKYLPAIRALISKDLSEPYSIYVYRYFLCQWAHLCFLVSTTS